MIKFCSFARILRTQSAMRARFCTQMTKKMLMNNLFSIDLINKNVSRAILAMAYSPGVGAVCQAIQKDPSVADTMTLRGRSVAIVTDGSFLDVQGKAIQPVMDWLICQIKYYSGLDAFPFIIRKGANVGEILDDLATCYGTVLFMDGMEIDQVPRDLLLLQQKDILKQFKCEVTDLQRTAHILAYLVQKKIKGIATKQDIDEGKNFQGSNFHNEESYGVQIKDGRDIYSHALQLHAFYKGKMQIELHFHDICRLKPHFTEAKLRELVKEKHVYSKTSQLSAIVTDGTAVLGYGNIGPMAGLPVMEGKSLLFKMLGDVQVVPVCIHPRRSIAEEMQAIVNLLGNFQAINLQDIRAPQCFDIESGLQQMKIMPIFHDDQHGTAIVTLAGLINAVKCVDKKLSDCKVVINGAGAAGITIANLLLDYGVKDIILCDSIGSIYRGRSKNMNQMKKRVAQVTNLDNKIGTLADVIEGTDIFVGVSSEKALKGHWVSKMNKKSIVFALANPIPEIMPNDAKASGAYVYGSGRSDFQNQINNSLVFPGIFRAIMQHRLKQITNEMKIKAAEAIAGSLTEIPRPSYIIPDSLDKDVAIRISRELGKLKKIEEGE